jgi:ABC-type multidrug transport system ATPase subunit
VNKCLKGDLVRGRTVLLVTHNVALAAPIADFVVSLGTDGRILASGSPSETVLKDRALAEQVAHEQAALELEEELEEEDDDDKKKAAKGAKLVVAEEIQHGHVSWKSMMLFLGSLSGWPIAFWTAYLGGRWCDFL